MKYTRSENMSDDRVSVKLRVTENYVLPICPSFTHTTLCESIERYSARIDYNQYNQYIYIYMTSRNPYPIMAYSVANYRAHLSHFW